MNEEMLTYTRKRQHLTTLFRRLRKARHHKSKRAIRRALGTTCRLLSMHRQEREVSA